MSDSLSGTDALSSMSPCKTMMSISLYFIPLRRTGMTLWGRVEERWEGSERREEREWGEGRKKEGEKRGVKEGRREKERRREMRDWGGEKGLGKGEGRERKEERRKE